MSEPVTVPPVGDYTIDPGRSRVTFSGRHLFGLALVRGGFAVNSGRVRVASPVTDSEAEAGIDAASVDTGNRQRNEIRSKRYLHTARYPVITFTSGRVRQTDGTWVLVGTLTVHEMSNTIYLDIERATVAPRTFTARARTRIDRTQFGVDGLVGLGRSTFGLVATLD